TYLRRTCSPPVCSCREADDISSCFHVINESSTKQSQHALPIPLHLLCDNCVDILVWLIIWIPVYFGARAVMGPGIPGGPGERVRLCGGGEASKGLAALHQPGDVSPIDSLRKRQQFAGELQSEIGITGQELVHHIVVLLRLQAAGAVNQPAAGFQQQGGLAQQLELRRAQTPDVLRTNAPTQINSTPHDPGVGTWGVDQDAVESG